MTATRLSRSARRCRSTSSRYYEHKSRQADPTSASGRHRNLAAAGTSLGCNAGRTLTLARHAGSLRTRTVRYPERRGAGALRANSGCRSARELMA